MKDSRKKEMQEAETMHENPEIPDELFKLAFQYRDTKLWKKLYDTEVFAVRFSTGEIGCCGVLGKKGNYISLLVYVGEKAVRSYLRMTRLTSSTSEAERFEAMHQQDCLQCGFYNKSDLAEEIIAPVQKYAKSHNISLKGKYTYPNFIASKPLHMPWFVTDNADFIYLQEALSAALEVADKLNTNTKEQLGFNSDLALVPLLCSGENGYAWETYQMPKFVEEYPSPELQDSDLIQHLSGLPKKGTWECEVVILPTPVASSTMGAPYFPTLLIAADTERYHMIPTYPIENYVQEAQQMLLELADAMLKAGAAPKLIAVPDQRTESLLSHFCEACSISCTITNRFVMLNEIREEMLGHLANESDEAMMDTFSELLMALPDEGLLAMPPELFQSVTSLLAQNALPPELTERIKRLFSL